MAATLFLNSLNVSDSKSSTNFVWAIYAKLSHPPVATHSLIPSQHPYFSDQQPLASYLSVAGNRRHCCLAPGGVSGPHCWAWVSHILFLGAWPAHSPCQGLSVGAGIVGTQTSGGTRRRARHHRAESRPTRLRSSAGHRE